VKGIAKAFAMTIEILLGIPLENDGEQNRIRTVA
jgi:hypothetical protein